MDGSSQLGVLSDPEHGACAQVVAGVEAQGEGDQHGMINRMSEWILIQDCSEQWADNIEVAERLSVVCVLLWALFVS